MTNVDRIAIFTFGFLILSVPGIFYLKRATPKKVVVVDVISKRFVPKGVEYRSVPTSTGSGRYPRAGYTTAPFDVGEHWVADVIIDGRKRSLKLGDDSKGIRKGDKLRVTYQYLTTGTFRLIRIDPPT